jgi:hypothetical protein
MSDESDFLFFVVLADFGNKKVFVFFFIFDTLKIKRLKNNK